MVMKKILIEEINNKAKAYLQTLKALFEENWNDMDKHFDIYSEDSVYLEGYSDALGEAITSFEESFSCFNSKNAKVYTGEVLKVNHDAIKLFEEVKRIKR